ncbi:DUF4124 domain-containing protein [Luteimonas yindakuii]|nr:DUF4124 domain-containing protein [Luteimonas yindakuii]
MWLALCAPAAAQTVYKCMGPDGAVFQSTPCGAGQQQERAYGGEAYATTPQRQAQIEREQARAQAVVRRNAGGAGRASTPVGAQSGQSSCDRVKAQRDRAMQALGNRRTYEQISYWATEVSKACNHRR